MSEKYHQTRVSSTPDDNDKLSTKDRLSNAEHDIVTQHEVMKALVTQNGKYTEYLDDRIKREGESYLFWVDIRKRLVTAGILGTVGIIGAALVYAITQWIKHQ